MSGTPAPLPIDTALPALLQALTKRPCAVLAAPPGAGKTTRVPPAVAAAPWTTGRRILMLEPRRVAARAAAERIAAETGEPVGKSVGYRIRGDTRIGPATRIEVVTEGILTRMLQTDPALEGVACVIFDEVHERSIHADLGMALTLEVQSALRDDLRIIAMSATLDTARFARLMNDAPVIESAGRLHPVETRWLDRPLLPPPGRGRPPRFEDRVAEEVAALMTDGAVTQETEQGDALVFLPGAGEIRRVASALAPRLPEVAIVPLHGQLPFAEQRRALMRDGDGCRRVVLSTAIAETSLTVEGVRIVVDAGRARRAEVNPATGLPRLVTRPVSRAEADQRRGRAGRLGPGQCLRLWTTGEQGALPAASPPEILTADLAALALELAAWGADDPGALPFLDPPPAPALNEARALLARLGALDRAGGATAHGRAVALFPAHPRLAHMVLSAAEAGRGRLAARLAALVEARAPLPGGADIEPSLRALENPTGAAREALLRIAAEAERLERAVGATAKAKTAPCPVGEAGDWLSLAFPDRIARRRPGPVPASGARYLLANGRGAALAPDDALAAQDMILALDVDDRGADARIRRAAALDQNALENRHGPRIVTEQTASWSRRHRRVEAETRRRLDALILDANQWRGAPPDVLGRALCEGLADLGGQASAALLAWPKGAVALRQRVGWLVRVGAAAGRQSDLPDLTDDALAMTAEAWLLPFLDRETTLEAIAPATLSLALETYLGHMRLAEIDRAAPAHIITPLGEKAAIDYSREEPTLPIRVQALFGETRHPTIGAPPRPLVLELLSPAGRPVQTTRDLPGFWARSYADVRKDMRARYPRHPWPENPAEATPTRRAKPRAP
ncbi:MAG: ATP-dependent helicase HrpB [Pseudomonadota bacterium]